jgi:Mg2+/Co2+ transporter CorB
VLAVLLVTSAFFSLAETAMMAVNRYRLRHRAQRGEQARGSRSRCSTRPTRCSA